MLKDHGILAEWAPLAGCCYVHTARNKLTQLFLDKEMDEILWWDADIGVEPEDVVRLCRHDREIVGGAAPFRFGAYSGFPSHVVRSDDGFPVGLPDEGLVEAKVVPTAMLKVKREVFEKLRDVGMAPLRLEYDRDTRKECMRYSSWFDFEADEINHLEYGEDVTFCRKCERAGYQLWIEPRMTIRHHGFDHRAGNFDTYLREINDTAVAIRA